MATIVKLQRTNPNEPWGFRIHGGRDFNQPIIVLKVTAGTLASSSGLTPGDQLASINGRDAGSLSHKDAEALIKNAGNEVAIGVYKTTQSTWKPNVQVLQQPNGGSGGESGSVLVNKQFNTPIAMYSEQSIAETLSAQAEVLAGGAIGVNFKKNEKKYNYENSEVYKMLQEVENERPSSAASNTGAGDFQQQQQQHSGDYSGASPGRTSASFVTNQSVPYANVLNRQQQPQQQPQQQQQQVPQQQQQFQPVVQQIQQQQIIPQQLQQQQPSPAAAPSAAPAGPIQQVTAPVTGTGGPPPPSAGGGSNVCADCERLIVGVFVRIKDKNLHVECFKCSTCGQSLKNVGYFNINNKLYCDIHAKTVARQNPPAPGLEPVTSVPKTPQLPLTPAAAMKPFSYTAQPAAAAAPPSTGGGGFPQMSPVVVDSYASKIAPLPFHHSPSAGGISHVTAPKSPQMLQQPQPFQQQQQQQLVQQQQQLQSSSSSSYQESTFKSTSSSSTSFESSSAAGAAAGGSKVTWPPSDIVPSPTPPQQQKQQQQQPKFRQQHVPYQPVASLLIQPAQQQQQQQPKFSPVQAPPTQPQQQQQFTAPFQAAPPPQQQVQPIQFTPLIPQQQPQQQQQPMFSSAPAPSAAGGANKPLPSFPIAPAPGPSAYNTASRNTTTSATLASRISRGILTHPSGGGGGPRVAVCGGCQKQIRGPFVTAGLKFYCPEHFKCGNGSCGRDLMEVGFVEEGAALYCEFCWEAHIAPPCGKCGKRIKYECIKAIGRDFHKECFTCKQCNRQFGNDPFFLEDGEPFCQADWNEMFTTKCHGCGFPIEAGDRWVEAMNNNYHSQCFNCSACKKNLEGQSFFAKAGRPFCKSHAR